METNNKLIAEFIGYKEYVNEGAIQLYIKDEVVKSIGQLDFHSDWNWLMEVVEKIFSLDDYYHFKQTLGQFDTSIRDRFPNKEGVYNQCIEFIKWYNENSAKEK